MTEDTVYSAISEIYAIFGKNAPSRSSTVTEVIARRVEDIPDRVRDYIVDRVAMQKALPANLSQAFRDAWESYCLAHPTAKAEKAYCRMCYGNGGWVYFKVIEGRTCQFWSFCPHCTPENEATRKTPRQLQDEGALVVPSNYTGGVARFRMDYGIDTAAPVNEYVARSIENIRAMMAAQRIQPGYAEG